MKYTINKMDGRFTYRNLFEYYIGFSMRMAWNNGPANFDRSLQWFVSTYGWSSEIRQYTEIQRWIEINKNVSAQLLKKSTNTTSLPTATNTGFESSCNPHWSWTNGYHDLRIYVRSEEELSFFMLANPVDQ